MPLQALQISAHKPFTAGSPAVSILVNAGADTGIRIADATTASLQLASTDGDVASGITFGDLVTPGSATLYRSAANTLRTDDSFIITGSLTLLDDTGNANLGITFGTTATDVNLYRLQPDTLRTDDNFVVGASLAVANRILVSSAQDGTTATQGIIFGLSEDTNLYRSKVNQLNTDDSFLVGASLAVGNRILISGDQDGTSPTNGLIFGLSEDTNLYRSKVNQLNTDDSFLVGASLAVSNRILLSGDQDGTSPTNGLIFGLSEDTNLYRSKVNQLNTDDSFLVGASLAVGNRILVSGDQDGTTATNGIIFGLSEDTNLYRSQPNQLKTDDSLVVGASLAVDNRILVSAAQDGTTATQGIIFGLSEDTNLYRSATNALMTDDNLFVAGTLTVTDSIVTPGSLLLSSDAGTFDSGIIFGTANTANLYRLQPDTLRTDDSLVVGASLAVANRIMVSSAQDGTTATQGIIFGLSEDTNLYRSKVNQLNTDDSFLVGASLAVGNRILLSGDQDGTSPTNGIIFGLSEDTNLYRSAANTLTTDDSFIVTGSLTVNDNVIVTGSISAGTSILVSSASDGTSSATGVIFGVSRDTNLFRSAANTLKTDDSLVISGSLSLGSLTLTDNTGNANLGITSGTTASSANLYRSAANTLSTNDSFIIAGSLTVNNNVIVSGSLSAGTSILVSSAADGITSATGIVFGLSRDTSLYRSKFDQLKTDDSLFVGASLAVGNRILVSSA